MANAPSTTATPHPPMLNIPPSTSAVSVRLIDTGARRTCKVQSLFQPVIPGFESVTLPSWSFLISHPQLNQHVLFDLSLRRDWSEGGWPPSHDDLVRGPEKLDMTVPQEVIDLLDSGALPSMHSGQIDAVIWSHHHFDHRGDITRFSSTTKLIIGPGLKREYGPGYPADPEGEIFSSELESREVCELTSEDFKLEIGGFAAHDYYGDGSLYLLSSPGHTVGHLCALARVTIEPHNTFVLMAGDVAHHPGVFRPSAHIPLPKQISVGSVTYDGELLRGLIHPKHSADKSFIDVDEEPMCHNGPQTKACVERLQLFDAREDVLVCIAHDLTLQGIVPSFPEVLDDWKDLGLKEKVRWEFLQHFDLSNCRAQHE